MHSSRQIWPINGPNLIDKSQSTKAIGGYRHISYMYCDSDQRGQRGPSIKRADQRPTLHRNIASSNNNRVLTKQPRVIAICNYDQSHRDIAIGDTQRSGYTHIYMRCD